MKKLFILAIVFAGFLFPVLGCAEDMEATCQQLTESTSGCPGLSSAECKALLQKCSDYYDEQSEQLSQDLTKTSKQKNKRSDWTSLQKRSCKSYF